MLIRTNVTDIGDPFVINNGKQYYMYATSFDVDGFKVWKSDDLKNWECLGVCLDLSDSWTCQDYWAPEVIYHNDKYVMHYTARRKSDKSLRLGVAVSERPEGPFVDVHQGPMFDFGYASIDGHVFVDDDGRAYFYYSKDCSENYVEGMGRISEVCVCEMSSDLLTLVGEPVTLFGPSMDYDSIQVGDQMWNEAPYVLKQDGVYYLTYSANCYATNDYCICLAKAKQPMGPFVKYDRPIMTCKDAAEDFAGPGHNAFFRDKDGGLMASFHIQTFPDAPSPNRKACICNAEIKNGTIVFEV
ncbi:MAG: glycoside hydrolase family 43 protein [Tyzzerella sp.]|nr:glycoside hydrolase family 43 protein [Tyzzerella sp.]